MFRAYTFFPKYFQPMVGGILIRGLHRYRVQTIHIYAKDNMSGYAYTYIKNQSIHAHFKKKITAYPDGGKKII